jgi:hypothetical protein
LKWYLYSYCIVCRCIKHMWNKNLYWNRIFWFNQLIDHYLVDVVVVKVVQWIEWWDDYCIYLLFIILLYSEHSLCFFCSFVCVLLKSEDILFYRCFCLLTKMKNCFYLYRYEENYCDSSDSLELWNKFQKFYILWLVYQGKRISFIQNRSFEISICYHY